MNPEKTLLLIIRCSPYGDQQARAALDVALTAAAFEMEVTVVFMDEGVLQLIEGQDTGDARLKNIGNMLGALPLYDVKHIGIHTPSAERFRLAHDSIVQEAVPMDDATLQQQIQAAGQVLVFR